MAKLYTYIVFFMLLIPFARAQEQPLLKGNVLALTFEEGWNTRSVGAGFRKENAQLPWAAGIRVYGIRHSREQLVRPSEIYTQPGNRFIFGKTNRMLGVAPYFEVSKTLIKPGTGELFDLQFFGQTGPVFGLERPYYVDIFQATGGGGPGQPISGISVPTPFTTEIGYTDILGRSKSLEYGWDQMRIVPGASLRLGARLGLARRPEYVTELVFSVQGDYFFQPVTLLTSDPAQQLFTNVSLGLILGSRW